MKLRDLVPCIDKEQPFVLMDIHDQHTTVEPNMIGLYVKDILNRDVIKVGRYRYSMYDEEDFLMVKVAYDKEEV